MPKVEVKSCRYPNCAHDGKIILIGKDEYVSEGRSYFHADCYKLKVAEDEKKKQQTADMALIRSMWVKNISQTVIFAELNKVLYDLLNRGIASDYLVFVMQYVVKNHCKLNYPGGFRYYVNDKDIKAEYEKKNRKFISMNEFKAQEHHDTAETEIKPQAPRKTGGFERILTGG